MNYKSFNGDYLNLNRKFIDIEKDKEIFNIAKTRLEEAQSINKSINNVIASFKMEEINISPKIRELAIKYLNKEITLEEYIKIAMEMNKKEIKE